MGTLAEEFGAKAATSNQTEAPGPADQPAEQSSLLGRIASDVGTGLTEIVPAVGSGIKRGLNEVSQAAFDLGGWANKNIADLGTVEIGRNGVSWRRGMPEKNDLQIPESVSPPRPTTVTGGVAEGASQFITGYVLGGKLLKGVGFTAARLAPTAATAAVVDAAATTGGKLAYSGTRALFSGAAAFDPSEERLSNFINEDTPLGNALTEYLAASPNDSRAEGRFKNAIENVILDVPLEAFFYAVKGIKAKRAGDTKAAEALAEQVERELNKAATSSDVVPRAETGPYKGPTLPEGTEFRVEDQQGGGFAVTIVDKSATGTYDNPHYVLEVRDDGRVSDAFNISRKHSKLGEALYIRAMEEAEKRGVRLSGSGSEYAQRVWTGLEEKGLASRSEVQGEDGPYTQFTATERKAEQSVPEIDFGTAPRRPKTKTSSPYDPTPETTAADGTVTPYAPPFDWGVKHADALLARYGKLVDDPAAMDAEAKRRLFTNMGRVADENDAKALFNEFGKIAYQSFVKSRGDVVSLTDVQAWAGKMADDLADMTGADVREMVLQMGADKRSLDALAERLAGYRAGVAAYSRRSTDLASAIKRGDFSEFGGDANAAKAEFLKATQTLYAIAPQTEGIKSGLGRNLSLLRASIGPEGKPTGKLAGISDEAAQAAREASPKAQTTGKPEATVQAELAGAMAGNEKQIEALVERLSRVDNPKAAKKVVDDAFNAGAMDVNNELWINALLSGPKTHIVNMATSTLKSALVMPTEQMLAGIISRDMSMFMMGADQYAGYFMSMRDAMRQAARSLKHNEAVLDPTSQGFGGTKGGSEGVINASTFGLNTDTPLGALVSGFGQLIRMPSRLLTTEDEFLKQLNYRARLYALATREAREMRRAHGAKPEELATFVAEYVARGFDENGAAIHPEALAWARDATFTNDLSVETWRGNRSVSESLNAFAATHPGFRMIMPFVRVPANIMRDVWDHTPGMNLLRRQYRAELEAGGERRAMALAKMATGGSMMTAAVMMAANGDIVGSLSSDPKVRRTQQDAGIIPNSFRVLDENGKATYYSFERFDPYATFFQTAAAFADVAGHLDNWKMEDLASSMVTALAKNLESKTYLQGLTEILGALSDPDSKAEKFIQRRAASYVPSVTNTFRGADYLSDPHNVAQAMQARTAGYGSVDARYNLLGERVKVPAGYGPDWLSPITMGKPDDSVLLELARLSSVHKGGLGYPSKTRSGGLDLDLTQFSAGDQTAYGRVQELASEVKIGGKTLRDRLTELFNSNQYKTKLTDGEPGIPGSRLTHTQATIEAYRQAAFQTLAKENPEFGAAYRDAQVKKLQMQRFGVQPQQ